MRQIIMICLITGTIQLEAQIVRNFQLKDLSNNSRSYEELKGERLTLIDFWASWCKPCLKAIPELNKIYEQYPGNELKIIGINNDGPRSVAKVSPMARSLNIQYPVLLDMDAGVMKDLNLIAYPTLILVDANDKIVWIHEGFVTGDEEIIEKEIQKHFNSTPTD
jgi:thiol-disulfide isomerase/thioredoxin